MKNASSKNKPHCAKCGVPDQEKICLTSKGRGPEFCPTLYNREVWEEAKKLLSDSDIREFARQASIQEAECYINRDKKPFVTHPVKPRLQEIIEFAGKMKYKRLGFVF